MKKIRKVIVTGRRSVSRATIVAKKVIEKLKEWGIQYEVPDYFPVEEGGQDINKIKGADMVLAFGGDGSFLRTFQRLKKRIPVLGINCGNRGYLMGLTEKNVIQKLPAVFDGKYAVEKRTTVHATVDGKPAGEALNEITILSKIQGRLVRYYLKINEKEFGQQANDGILIATPTGSTAHARSAGGPEILQNAPVLVVVGLNPIDLNNRPLVINDTSQVTIHSIEKPPLQVIIDGQKDFLSDKEIVVRKGKIVLLAKPQNPD